MHAALSARRAWPSFSCRCVSTGEACQTPGSPFQRCQRTFQVLSGARIENKGGENKGGEGGRGRGVFVVSTKSHKKGQCKNDKKQWIPHIPCYNCICVTCYLHKVREIQYQLRTVRWKTDTSSLVLSTSLGSLALPLLVIMSIS